MTRRKDTPPPQYAIVSPSGQVIDDTIGAPGERRKVVITRFIQAMTSDPLANWADYTDLGYKWTRIPQPGICPTCGKPNAALTGGDRLDADVGKGDR